MLIKVIVENFKSFDKKTELSMISSSKIQEKTEHRTKIKQTTLLKNSVIYGANASGKSNLVTVFSFIKKTLIEGLTILSVNDFCRNKAENETRDSFFEIQFTVGDSFYAYGFTGKLSEGTITEEWLYELKQSGSARKLFEREANNAPTIGEDVKLSASDKSRFKVYSRDFVRQHSNLFLSEMNRGKIFDDHSKLLFFKETFDWIMNNIIVIYPNMAISDSEAYYNNESISTICRLIQTFDTGITDIKTKKITPEEMRKIIPEHEFKFIFNSLIARMTSKGVSELRMTWRLEGGFFNIRIRNGNSLPEITTLVLKHGQSSFDFSFVEESDGSKRLFDLIDMILTDRQDTVFVVDELERSLHPKLTERFLKLFMEAHKNSRVQLVFSTHEDSIMDRNLFRRDEIWFIERDANNASTVYPLDRFKERYDKKLSKAYLDGRYGAIPVFSEFSFQEGE